MSYENAVPKPLKFLISDGKMIDDAGNVIAESDTLKDLYTKWEPEVKKYLLSDGSVVDENNNVIVKNDWWKSFYDMACPKIAKYLHADGTVDENPGGGGGADLEDNHQTTIDVSAYTEPVEITPTAGKDGMKKVTVSLSNMPAGTNMLYSWNIDGVVYYLNINTTPAIDNLNDVKVIYYSEGLLMQGYIFSYIGINVEDVSSVESTEDGFVIYSKNSSDPWVIFVRDATKDVTIW